MNRMKSYKINPQPPEKFTGLKKKAVKKTAVGLQSVISSLKHVDNEMDWNTGFKALNK